MGRSRNRKAAGRGKTMRIAWSPIVCVALRPLAGRGRKVKEGKRRCRKVSKIFLETTTGGGESGRPQTPFMIKGTQRGGEKKDPRKGESGEALGPEVQGSRRNDPVDGSIFRGSTPDPCGEHSGVLSQRKRTGKKSARGAPLLSTD